MHPTCQANTDTRGNAKAKIALTAPRCGAARARRTMCEREGIMRQPAILFVTVALLAGKLSGMVIRSEAVQRATVRMSIDWKGQTFEGELQTSGTFDGTPEDLMLTAKSLVLKRTEGVVSVRRP